MTKTIVYYDDTNNYDKFNEARDLLYERFADSNCWASKEDTLIFFIRHKDTPDVPFVTVEYSVSKHKVLQCYAKSNSKPDDDVYKYIHKNWLPYANRQLKKLCA